MHALGRLILWCVGLVLAIPAGALALLFGVMAEPAARELIALLGLAALDALFAAAAGGGDPDLVVASLFAGFWMLSLVLVIGPVTLVSTAGEIVGSRSFAFYGGLTALLTAAIPWLLRAGPGPGAALAAEGRLTAILFVTGAVAGLVYWAVAGRSAGRDAVGNPSP